MGISKDQLRSIPRDQLERLRIAPIEANRAQQRQPDSELTVFCFWDPNNAARRRQAATVLDRYLPRPRYEFVRPYVPDEAAYLSALLDAIYA